MKQWMAIHMVVKHFTYNEGKLEMYFVCDFLHFYISSGDIFHLINDYNKEERVAGGL